MDFDIEKDFHIFDEFLAKRPEVIPHTLKNDLRNYYIPYVGKLTEARNKKHPDHSFLVGVSAIQGSGKTTQGEVLEILFGKMKRSIVSISIDDFYLPHEELEKLKKADPRYIARGVTHDTSLAVETLSRLEKMKDGETVKIPVYDKGAFGGDGDRAGWREIKKRPEFIFFDGWMVGTRRVKDESVFHSGLPALDTSEHIQFAKDINKRLDEYLPLWSLLDFLTVLYVPDYKISLKWRDQAEEVLRKQGRGMSHDQIREFEYYFWRSVHPAIHIKNLAHDEAHTNIVVIINNDHTVREMLTPQQAKLKYP